MKVFLLFTTACLLFGFNASASDTTYVNSFGDSVQANLGNSRVGPGSYILELRSNQGKVERITFIKE